MSNRPVALTFVFALLLLQPAQQYASAGVLSVPFFYAKDGRWANNQMGSSGTTIGKSGCAITSVAMLMAYRGIPVDPGKLNAWLSRNGGYSSDGSLKWASAANFGSMCWSGFGWLGTSTLTSPLDTKRSIDSGQLLVVASARFSPHWVVLVGYTGQGTNWSDFVYRDPADSRATDRRVNDGWVQPRAATRVYKSSYK